jgi:hypothetical protein
MTAALSRTLAADGWSLVGTDGIAIKTDAQARAVQPRGITVDTLSGN